MIDNLKINHLSRESISLKSIMGKNEIIYSGRNESAKEYSSKSAIEWMKLKIN